METVKREVRNDLFLLQLPAYALIIYFTGDYYLCLSFLLGSLISLANFNLLASQSASLLNRGEENLQRRIFSGFGLRYLMMAGTLGLSLTIPQVNPYALVSGLLGVQYVLFGREFLKRFGGWLLA